MAWRKERTMNADEDYEMRLALILLTTGYVAALPAFLACYAYFRLR